MKHIEFSDVKITGGHWRTRQAINRDVTVGAIYEKFKDTRFNALKCEWKEGDPNFPHIFWDSDVAKWMEGASYILTSSENNEILQIIEQTMKTIMEHSDENGYFNSHFNVKYQNERFWHRCEHELYCAGHLIEAAVAYYNLTGKTEFLNAMCKYADYIEKCFKKEKWPHFTTPGHPEIELALMRLYKATGVKRYADLAKHFIDEHGMQHPNDSFLYSWATNLYNQDDVPVRERNTADGHCVRALYLLCGMADVALEYNDNELKEACKRCFDNIVNKRMYITGGLGSTNLGEAFTIDYDLPNRTAYAETCAAIALAFFSNRMLSLEADAKYADAVERTMYNGIMSGISLDGKAFFYENPLEVDPDFNDRNPATTNKDHYPLTQRLELFGCSCCPPNVMRFVASIGGYIYGYDEDTVFVNQYIESEFDVNGTKIKQITKYPENGKVHISCLSDKKYIAVRIPFWCENFKINHSYTTKNGYAIIELGGNTEIDLDFDMPVRLMCANRRVHSDAGRIAVMRGPVVYCAEGVDNGKDISSVAIDINSKFKISDSEFLLPVLKTTGYRPPESESLYSDASDNYEKIPLTLIPFYAFANRDATEMTVWLLRK